MAPLALLILVDAGSLHLPNECRQTESAAHSIIRTPLHRRPDPVPLNIPPDPAEAVPAPLPAPLCNCGMGQPRQEPVTPLER